MRWHWARFQPLIWSVDTILRNNKKFFQRNLNHLLSFVRIKDEVRLSYAMAQLIENWQPDCLPGFDPRALACPYMVWTMTDSISRRYINAHFKTERRGGGGGGGGDISVAVESSLNHSLWWKRQSKCFVLLTLLHVAYSNRLFAAALAFLIFMRYINRFSLIAFCVDTSSRIRRHHCS